jgi:hypothetical protein
MRGFVRAATIAATLGVIAPQALADQRLPAEEWAQRYESSISKLPLCSDQRVLENINTHFTETEQTYWNSSLTILTFEGIRPVAYRAWGLDFIPRRFCSADVVTSDNHRRRLEYSVIEGGNVAGWSWGVEWCITGLDREWGYRPNCKMARP